MISSQRERRLEELIGMVRHAVLHDWDPIGVGEFPEAADEYDAYVLDIAREIIKGYSVVAVFEHLWYLETEHLGLPGDRAAAFAFAEELVLRGKEIMGE